MFYEQGFPNTGINQILEESGAYKASLYKYYKTKDDLGIDYLRVKSQEFIEFLALVMRKHSHNHIQFIHSWVGILRRSARKPDYRGCALANFTAQTLDNRPAFESATRQIIDGWITFFQTYLDEQKEQGFIPGDANTARIAAKFLKFYEGAIQLYNMTGDIKYIEELEQDLLDAVAGSRRLL